jgi:hypothetical protein
MRLRAQWNANRLRLCLNGSATSMVLG